MNTLVHFEYNFYLKSLLVFNNNMIPYIWVTRLKEWCLRPMTCHLVYPCVCLG